ncbi:BMC domain-containing protein [Senegalia sp. (in: firmicutes)]|uniref:BMC domain-containing protein n=2 Tax=Senegalia sp. (in: firmicutes) TaxID=1924098 RepID=UPI003F99515A
MANEALGMIETYGYIGAVEAADVCVKSANVKLLGLERVRGGLVTIHITGDIGAVKASIDAAESAVKKFGSLVSSHVIPRAGEGIEKLLPKIKNPDNPEEEKEEKKEEEIEDEEASEDESETDQVIEKEEKIEEETDTKKQDEKEDQEQEEIDQTKNKEKPKLTVNINTPEELRQIKTVKLRAIARELDDKFSEYLPIERSQIKYSKKGELINAILTFYERVK